MISSNPPVDPARLAPLWQAVLTQFDFVITVCDAAAESCPMFPGTARKFHRGFEDPPHVAREARSEEEALDHYRRVRDQICAFVETLPEALTQDECAPRARLRFEGDSMNADRIVLPRIGRITLHDPVH